MTQKGKERGGGKEKYEWQRKDRKGTPLFSQSLPLSLLGLKASFLSRVSILTRDIDIAILSVRPSVCP